MGLEELPGEIAAKVDEAVQSTNADAAAEIRKEELAIEKARIKSEERIVERQAERDEHIAEKQFDTETYKSMLDEFFNRLGGLLQNTPSQVTVDASHEQHEIPGETESTPASEDSTPQEPQNEVVEGIEEIGGEAEQAVESAATTVDNTVEENTNGNSGKSGRRKKRRRK